MEPPSPSKTRDFAFPSASKQQSLASQQQPSSQDSLSFGTTFDSALAPSQTSVGSKSYQHPSQHLLLGDSDITLDGNLQQQASELLATSNHDGIPYGNIQLEHRVSPDEPWNHVNAVTPSMTPQPGQQSLNSQHAKRRAATDSGYASSRNTRPRLSANLPTARSQGLGQTYPYDEPLGSTAQQDHFLPDQQTQLRADPPRSTSVSLSQNHTLGYIDSGVLDPSLANSGPQSFRCEDCDERFNTKSEMSKHMARHSKKNYCDVPGCPRTTDGFATKNDLDRHKSSVHNDSTVSRKLYNCSVPGCKDPSKTWNRKDNFKAHVKRMHPEADADAIVEQSYQSDQHSIDGQPVQHSSYANSDMGLYQPYHLTSPHPLHTPSMMPDPWPQEGDLYDPSSSTTSYPQQQQYLESPVQGHYQGYHGAIPPANSNYASSTMLTTSNVHDQGPPPLLSHRVPLTPVFPNYYQYARPMDAQTVPIMGPSTDEFQMMEFSQNGDNLSMMGSGVPAIDPVLQTLQTGSWQSTSSTNLPQQAEIPDNTSSVADSQTLEQERREAVYQQLKAILKPLPYEDMNLMLDMWKQHPPVYNKATCAVKSALDAVKANDQKSFPCQVCGKRYTQNNIRKKHERRHEKLFFCTFDGCYQRFGTKDDLRRHEKRKHAAQEFQGWRCFIDDVTTSQHKPECFRFFEDEEKFKQHRREEHRERAQINNGGLKASKICHVLQGKPGHFWCGFCNKVIQNEPSHTDGTKVEKFRYDHLDQHITKEKKTMDEWIDLKSDGLTKKEVMEREKSQEEDTLNNESDIDDEDDLPSPGVSNTIRGTISQAPTHSSQHLGLPPVPGRRKRALSAADGDPVINKSLKTTHLQKPSGTKASSSTLSQQDHSTSRGLSNAPTPGLITSIPHGRRPQSSQIAFVQCCQCKNTRPATTGTLCSSCYHACCLSCPVWDNIGNRINQRPHPGSGPSSSPGH